MTDDRRRTFLRDLWMGDPRPVTAWLACFRAQLKRWRGDPLTAQDIDGERDGQALLLAWDDMTLERMSAIVERVCQIAIADGYSEALRGEPCHREPNWQQIKRVIYKEVDLRLAWWDDPQHPLNTGRHPRPYS